jgi:putative hydrolase of the HAD superfamily
VSFDVTGTLFGVPRLGEVYAEVFARHGLAASPQALAAMVAEVWQEVSIRTRLGECRFASHPEGAKGFWRDLLARVAERLELPPPTPFLAAELYDRFARADAWDVYPEVPDVLEGLREAGLRLAVTSNFDARLPRLLADTGLAEQLEVVVYSAEVGVEKPHPAIFEELLEALKLPAESVLHVGDSRRNDVEGALAVGMRALWLTRGSQRGDLSNLAELPARIELPLPRRPGARSPRR